MPRSLVAVAVLLVLAGVTCARAQVPQREYARVLLTPTDDACEIASLCGFRRELVTLVTSRDAKSVARLMSPRFNGVAGRGDAFAKALVDSRSPAWREMGKILALGGSVERRGANATFCAPYAYTRYPAAEQILSDADSDGYAAVVIAADAAIRAKPNASADVIGRVGHELIAESGNVAAWHSQDAEPNSWFQVVWQDRSGYILRSQVWSPNDPHLCLGIEDGRWMLQEFRDPQGRFF